MWNKLRFIPLFSQMEWWIQAGNASFEVGHCQLVPFWLRRSKLPFVGGGGERKKNCWRQAHITLHERCKVSTDISKRILEDGLNLRTFTTRWIPQTKQQTERSWRLKERTCWKCLHQIKIWNCKHSKTRTFRHFSPLNCCLSVIL